VKEGATAADWLAAWSTLGGVFVAAATLIGVVWTSRRALAHERDVRRQEVERIEAERWLEKHDRAALVYLGPPTISTLPGPPGHVVIQTVSFTVRNDSDKPIVHVSGELYLDQESGGPTLLAAAVSAALARVPGQGVEALHFLPAPGHSAITFVPQWDDPSDSSKTAPVFSAKVRFRDLSGTRWRLWNNTVTQERT
jgi:hypothetical protein